MLLLLLARGLQRRIETVYYLTVTLLAAGIVVSLLKGFDFEEAFILAVMLSIMLPVFYQVSEDQLSLYVEMGLSVIKIGEEARVHLPDFTLEGHDKRNLRRSLKRLSEMGCDFSVIPQPEVRAILPELRKISDDWLGQKNAAEKGFSLRFFTEDYVADFPVAVIKVEGRITAFANIWVSAEKRELSVDLMRYDAHAPSGVMEYLFLQIMQWGKATDYEWFSLGMAPLSGIDSQQNAPRWNQIASLTYRHGEHFYNLQGLRQYKSKFDPEWQSKYIASPGGFSLPLALTNVASLISGGMMRLVKK
ncbi:MAG: hypothetical protein CMJ80_02235 [Planctomycetaceae bacterium]|nr:hypothetical protein [Planctomycetaceae bacterium]